MSRATKSYKHVGVSHVREKSCDTFHFQTVGGADFGAAKPTDDRGLTLFRAGICVLPFFFVYVVHTMLHALHGAGQSPYL